MCVKMLLLLVFVVCESWASLCPTKCTCYLDQKGRISVLCKDGGLTGPLDLSNITLDTEVIKITAPDDNMNQLTMSPVFQSYKKLEEIHITKSNIPQLGMHFFWGLTKLDVLNLSQNNITQPLDHNFRGLSKLKELYLDDNRIISLPSGTFRYLHELKVLSIQRNRIEELTPRIFLEVGKLRVLKLTGNRLRELNPEVFKDVQELRSLECRCCALKRLNNEIYHLLPHLTHLDLGDNEIETLNREDLRDLTNLKHLKLDGNQIKVLHNLTFMYQPMLKRLNLARNQIGKVSLDAFRDAYNLTELDIGFNGLKNIEFLRATAESLEVLVLSGNHLKQHALRLIFDMINLRELHLQGCGLADIRFPIFPPTLSVLDLSCNHLSSLQRDYLPPNLNELDISSNRFRGLSEEVLVALDDVQRLTLDNNIWSCDLCHIVPLLDRINRSISFREVSCAAPFAVQGKKLGTIKKSELSWCTPPTYPMSDADYFLVTSNRKVGLVIASTTVVLFVSAILVVIVAFCYSKRHAAKYYTHEEQLAKEGESIFENNHSPLFCDGELSFKFPLDSGEKKISIATIDEIRKEHPITNEI